MVNTENLKPFQKGEDPRRQNGRKVGSKNVSTIVRNLLESDLSKINSNSVKNLIEKQNYRTAKEAIVSVMIEKALEGDLKSVEWLFKYIDQDDNLNQGFFEKPLAITIIDPKHKTEKLL